MGTWRWTKAAGIICALFALGACTDDLLTEVEPGAVMSAHGRGGGPGGGGGGGGNTGPSPGNVATLLTDGPGDGISSDDGTAYVTIKKKGVLTSEVDQFGKHALGMAEEAPRRLCVEFPLDAEIWWSTSDWDDLVTASGGAIGLGLRPCTFGGFHTASHSHPDRLLAMAPGDVQTAGGKLTLVEFDVARSWEWRLYFNSSDGNLGEGKDGLCIRYDPDGTWTIGTDPTIDDTTTTPTVCDDAGVDEFLDLVRNPSSGVFIPVARFRMPFSYTVTPD